MPHYQVVIETHPIELGGGNHFGSHVAQGPQWTKGRGGLGPDRRAAFEDGCNTIRSLFPRHTFEFLHAES